MNSKQFLFEVSEDLDIKLTKYALAFNELQVLDVLDKKVKNKKFALHIKWLYLVYWKGSPYRNFTLAARKKYVWNEYLKIEKSNYTDLDMLPQMQDAIKILNEIQYTQYEKYLISLMNKCGQFLDLWQDTLVDHQNYNELSKIINQSPNMFEMKKKLQTEFDKEMQSIREREDVMLFEVPDEEIMNFSLRE